MCGSYFYTGETFDTPNWEEERKMFEICSIAPLKITHGLVTGGNLKEEGKLILITSEGGSLGIRSFEEVNRANSCRPLKLSFSTGWCTLWPPHVKGC